MSRQALLTVKELAAYLGVSRATVYNWIGKKGLPALKIGNTWKFRQNEVDGWLDSSFKQNPADEISWEQNWRPLWELTDDMLCLAGFDGYFKRLNPAWTRILGWREEELMSKQWLDFVHPDDVEKTLETGSKLLSGESIVQFENRYRCKDGSYRWISWNSVPSLTKKLIFAVARDISALKQTRMELQHTGEELSRILDSVPSLVFYKDTENNFIRVNKATADMLGIPKEQIEGASCFDLFPKDLAAKYWKDDQELLKSGEPRHGILEPLETGSVKRWNLTDKIPFIDAEGNRMGVIGVSTDITELKETEEELRLFENVIASAPDLISIVDKSLHYRFVNESYSKIWQKEKSGIEGRHISELVGRESFDKLIRPRLVKAFSGEHQEYSAWFEVPGRGRRFFVTSYHPVENKNGDIEHVVVNARDNTERKLDEQELQLQKDRLAMASEAGGIGVWEYNIETGELHWDQGMYNLYHASINEFSGEYEAWRSRLHAEDVEDAETALENSINNNKPFEHEFRIVVPGGGIRHIKAAARLRQREDSSDRYLIGVNWDITEHKRLEAQIRTLANTDPLTGAINRRQFVIRGNEELARSKRHKHSLALVMIDLDHFKQINDQHGHAAGDEVLRDFVKNCERELRISDIICRLGGEEFAIMLPETGEESALQTAERLRKIIEQTPAASQGTEISYTFSAGVTLAKVSDDSIDFMLNRADKALYKAKEQGRNRIVMG